ncbi:MAG: methyltransferase domain-containing protein [Vicinamibacteria bacterium]|nr:methyltransferase domain-containing protein [Vicinamibacteria bacterium]
MNHADAPTERTVDGDSPLPAHDSFREVHKYYNRFYSTTNLHYAQWDSKTKSTKEAIQNTNRIVCEMLCIKNSDVILDAGCGPGGTSIYIARRYGARVEGIDASPAHIDQARKNAASENMLDLVRFSLQDHRHTGFHSAQFDNVIAIESVLASENAADFLKEAHRVLKRGGKIAIVTMHLSRSTGGASIFKKRHAGHAAFEINRSKEEFCAIIERAGFRNVQATDLMCQIRLVSRTPFVIPIVIILALSKLKIVNAAMGAHLQTLLETERAMAKGDLGMAAFVAER